MTEQAPETQAAPANSEQVSESMFDGDFDAERAKGLIERLREENKSLKSDRTPQDQKDAQAIAALKRQIAELEPRARQFEQLEEASKSEAQRKDEAAATAQRERDEAKAEASIYKVAIRHGISEEDFDLLGTGSEEQIEARAVKIAAKNEAAKQAALEAAVQAPNTPSPRRPTEQLRPGVSPSSDPVQDESHYPSDWLSPSQRASLERARNS